MLIKTHQQSIDYVKMIRNQPVSSVGDFSEYDSSFIPTKGTLIVCPLSTIQNWEEQIKSHCKIGALSVYIYHGTARCRDPRIMARFVKCHLYHLIHEEYRLNNL